MITIRHLEVQFDVEGTDEERLFVEYFNKYIGQWSQRRDAQKHIRDTMDRNRDLGDRGGGERMA
jgi:hypothetical protein